jgi:predicted O-linked N-acetylglucosamine transferase (SPINDLY family)
LGNAISVNAILDGIQREFEMRTIAQTIMQKTSELAVQCEFERALEYLLDQERKHPHEPCILIYAGMVCTSMGKTDAAIGYYQENSKRFPRLAINYVRIAELFEKRGMIDQAIVMWKKGLELKGDPKIHTNMLQAMLKSPTLLSGSLLQEQLEWVAKHANPSHLNNRYGFESWNPNRTIRLGYVCAFWHRSAFKSQLLSIVQSHDRSQFMVYAYSAEDAPPDYQTQVDVFRVVGHLDDARFIEQVREDKIDILIECTGFSPGHRFAAMASRCAPIQISYLNHTGTTALPAIDYVLADDISLRRSEDQYFTETVYRLPGSFFSFDYENEPYPEPGPPPCLKNGYVTFGYFCSNGKLNDILIGWWAGILHGLPGSKLYIRNNELKFVDDRKFLRQRFFNYGIDGSRLIIRPGTHRNGIIHSYQEIDISLDTWPYCGGNTIAESLWQGVPVITYRGQRFSQSYGASLLSAAGCGELVAKKPEQYIQKAVDLGKQKSLIGQYRKNLRQMVRKNGFNDSKAFARKLECAYLEMIRKLNHHSSFTASPEPLRQSL